MFNQQEQKTGEKKIIWKRKSIIFCKYINHGNWWNRFYSHAFRLVSLSNADCFNFFVELMMPCFYGITVFPSGQVLLHPWPFITLSCGFIFWRTSSLFYSQEIDQEAVYSGRSRLLPSNSLWKKFIIHRFC